MAKLDSGNPFRSDHRACVEEDRVRESRRQGVAVATLLLIVVNGSWAQEMDSKVLQEETARKAQESATATSTRSSPTTPAPTKGLFRKLLLSRPLHRSLLSQAGHHRHNQANSFLCFLRERSCRWDCCVHCGSKPGRDVYLQITFPVTVGNQMLIPPGAYIQGVVAHIIKKDRRSLEFSITSANLIFFNGYTVPISGTVTVGTTTAALVPPQPGSGNGQSVPAMAAVGSVAPPPLPPLPPLPSFNGMRNAMIGVGVAVAVGTTVLIVLAHNRDPEIEVGTPLEIMLPAPVYLDATRVRRRCSNTTSRPATRRCRSCSLLSEAEDVL